MTGDVTNTDSRFRLHPEVTALIHASVTEYVFAAIRVATHGYSSLFEMLSLEENLRSILIDLEVVDIERAVEVHSYHSDFSGSMQNTCDLRVIVSQVLKDRNECLSLDHSILRSHSRDSKIDLPRISSPEYRQHRQSPDIAEKPVEHNPRTSERETIERIRKATMWDHTFGDSASLLMKISADTDVSLLSIQEKIYGLVDAWEDVDDEFTSSVLSNMKSLSNPVVAV